MPRYASAASLILLAVAAWTVSGNEREEQLRKDREAFETGGGWIYNDLKRGYREAKRTGKPLFVVLRCVP